MNTPLICHVHVLESGQIHTFNLLSSLSHLLSRNTNSENQVAQPKICNTSFVGLGVGEMIENVRTKPVTLCSCPSEDSIVFIRRITCYRRRCSESIKLWISLPRFYGRWFFSFNNCSSINPTCFTMSTGYQRIKCYLVLVDGDRHDDTRSSSNIGNVDECSFIIPLLCLYVCLI